MNVKMLGTVGAAAVLVSAMVIAQDRPRNDPPRVDPRQDQPLNRRDEDRQNNAQLNDRPDNRANDPRNNANRPIDQRDQPRVVLQNEARNLDSEIVNCLLLGSQEEVALSRWALERSQHPQVKDFAQKMITDHQQVVEKLRRHASFQGTLDSVAAAQAVQQDRLTITTNRPVSPPDETGAPRVNPRNEQIAQQPGENRRVEAVVNANQNDASLNLQRATAEECLKLTKEALAKHQGADFDKAFVGHQAGAHIGMLAKLNASQQHASPELRKVIEEGQAMTKRHQEHIDHLMADLKGDNHPDSNRPAAR